MLSIDRKWRAKGGRSRIRGAPDGGGGGGSPESNLKNGPVACHCR